MNKSLRFYRYANVLSLDVSAGAMVCMVFFARIFGLHLRPQGILSLGITVWIIYSVDHLLDARRLNEDASTNRHLFHQRHQRVLAIIVVIAAVLDLMLILQIRIALLYGGLALAMIVILYLLFHRRITPFKELAAAILYSGGVFLPVLSLYHGHYSIPDVLFMGSFLFTSLINLILFSWYDWQYDKKDVRVSLATFLGKDGSTTILTILFLVQFFTLVCLFLTTSGRIEAGIILTMNLILAILFFVPEKFADEDYYRLAGDFVFLLPLPYLILYGQSSGI